MRAIRTVLFVAMLAGAGLVGLTGCQSTNACGGCVEQGSAQCGKCAGSCGDKCVETK